MTLEIHHFIIVLYECMESGWDPTRDTWICSQKRICSQARYRLRYATIYKIVSP